MDYLKYKKICMLLSFILIVSGIVYGLNKGFKFDIDFMGGTRIQIDLGEEYNEQDVKDIVKGVVNEVPLVQTLSSSENAISITTNTITEEQANKVVEMLGHKYVNIGEATTRNVQPSYGKELIETTIIASVVALILLFIYIVIRFRILGVAPAISAILALVHDVLVMIAIYGFLGLPINSTFVAVVLTILGYSINDTMVIFDRIRENKRKVGHGKTFPDAINLSIGQTMKRCIYTSITTIIAVVILYVLAKVNGQQVLQEFALPLIIGLVSGTYSSIFIAPGLLVYANTLEKKFKK